MSGFELELPMDQNQFLFVDIPIGLYRSLKHIIFEYWNLDEVNVCVFTYISRHQYIGFRRIQQVKVIFWDSLIFHSWKKTLESSVVFTISKLIYFCLPSRLLMWTFTINKHSGSDVILLASSLFLQLLSIIHMNDRIDSFFKHEETWITICAILYQTKQNRFIHRI